MYINELIQIVREGFLIKIRKNNNDKWQYNIVQAAYNDIIAISVSSSDLSFNKVGQDIFIKINFTKTEYLAKGTILEISKTTPSIAKVKLVEAKKYPNRRRHERYATNIGCNIKTLGEHIGSFALILNFSLSGVYLESNLDFDLNNKIKMDIVVENSLIINLIGQISRNNKYGYAMIFKDNLVQNLEQLKNFINSLENLEFSILREWEHKKLDISKDALSNLKVLITDDIKFTRSFLKDIIQSLGIKNIYEASNGNEAIQKTIVFDPDIITLDISMPGIDGIEALKHIRNSNSNAEVVIISGLIDEEIRKSLSQQGVKYFISKPFEQSQVIETILQISREVILC